VQKTLTLLACVEMLLLLCGAVAMHAQNYNLLYSIQCGADGSYPFGSVIRDSDGNLYATTIGKPNGAAFKVSSTGALTVLHDFISTPDGSQPGAGLISGLKGYLFGTTFAGGASGYAGTIFEVTASGTQYSILHSFIGVDGAFPWGTLTRDASGNLYGTTYAGGKYDEGTVFELSSAGTLTMLHSFGFSTDGQFPYAGLVRDVNGNMYGTTSAGGTQGLGTVYKIDSAGAETVLYNFAGTPDGRFPHAGVTRDSEGSLYGTTELGGAFDNGTVFKLDSNGQESVLFSFSGKRDGGIPVGGLVEDSKGDLYGTTSLGGSKQCNSEGCGTIFEINPLGKEKVLHTFSGTDGMNPYATLLRSGGSLYGTTAFGGMYGCGTIFQLTSP
jgi:uncharacterized repeat protein (TIGR03803 family)